MRIWIRLIFFVALFAGVFFYRRAATQPRPSGTPFGDALPADAERPGNPVSMRLGRSALEVDGDAADPIQDIKLFRVGEKGAPETKVEFTGGWNSAVHALWFFDLDPKATYRAEVQTQFRKESRELRRDKVEPIEIQRVRVHGRGAIAEFSPDGKWLAVGSSTGDMKLVSVTGEQTRINTNVGTPIDRFMFSNDCSTLVAWVEEVRPIVFDVKTGQKSLSMLEKDLAKPNPMLGVLKAHAVSDDLRWIVEEGSSSGSVRLTETPPNDAPASLFSIPHRYAASSGDLRFIAVIDEKNLSADTTNDVDIDVIVYH